MGHWFVIQCKWHLWSTPLMREFKRRYWNEQEQLAELGSALRLYPFDR